ncbi:LLM class flavin-dependent oxidoreductase [Janibacter sp. RAF52]|uniref:LLM class flavin-dependent oxidoreductase n=1 Tax=unclassified Janibacter TaxID=2649294 RepID=UPI003F8FE2F1
MSTRRQLHLNAFIMPNGHHEAAWRHRSTRPTQALTLQHYVDIARTAERGLLDSVFLADTVALGGNVRHNSHSAFEPLTLLSALAASTERVGLIATASTTYNHPYTLARAFASLDHLSGGRAGWNIVTSGTRDEAANFGITRPDHGRRYERAAEFVELAAALWDSFGDGAVLADAERGIYADTDLIHRVDHHGEHFDVAGPLNVPRPVQGYPLLVQAGSSATGRAYAARYAEAVFTAQQTLEEGIAFYADLKGRLADHGRSRDELLVLPGISPVIGSTQEEARRLEAEINAGIVPAYGLAQLSSMLDIELTEDQLDEPLPHIDEVTQGNQSRFTLVTELARREQLTVRQLIERLAGGRGHRVLAGTPEQFADDLETWFTKGAADGFNIMPPTYPQGLEVFVDTVVPILQQRGLFRTEYTGTTLREHYGLARPSAGHIATTITSSKEQAA